MTSEQSPAYAAEARRIGRVHLLRGGAIFIAGAGLTALFLGAVVDVGIPLPKGLGALSMLAVFYGLIELFQGVCEAVFGVQLRLRGAPENRREEVARAIFIVVFFALFFGPIWYFFVRG